MSKSEHNEKPRVMIAEDHKSARKLLRMTLEQDERFKVVAETGDGQEAIDLAGRIKPDVIVMDIRLNSLGGIEATKKIKEDYPLVKIIPEFPKRHVFPFWLMLQLREFVKILLFDHVCQ